MFQMKNAVLILLGTFLFTSSIFTQLQPPYDSIEVLSFKEGGWYVNGSEIEKLIKTRKVKVIVELGSWLGRSTRHMAGIIPEDGVVYAVDHWLGSDGLQITYADLIPTLYQQFLSNMIHAKLAHKIIPIKMSTLQAAKKCAELRIKPDLIYVDASHDEKSVYDDLCAWYPFVKGHGIICGDDWGWHEESIFTIQAAVNRFARENNLIVEVPNGWMWLLREPASSPSSRTILR